MIKEDNNQGAEDLKKISLTSEETPAIEGLKQIEQSPKLSPNPWEFYHELGESLLEKGHYQEAVLNYRHAIKLNPEFCWSYNNLGDALLKLENWQEAADAYLRAIKLNPEFCWSYNNLGDALLKLKNWQEAADAYLRAIKLNPDFCWSYNNLGDALLKLENWQEAAGAYRRAIDLNPDFWSSYYHLGEALLKLENWQEAAAASRRAIELNSEVPWAYYHLGTALQKQGKMEEAIAVYRTALARMPNDYWLYEVLGQVLMEQQQWEEAIAYFIGVLKRKPDFFKSYEKIAEILEEQGELQAALDCRFKLKLPLNLLEKHCQFTENVTVTSQSEPSITRINIYPATQMQLLPSKTLDSNVISEFTGCLANFNEFYVAVVPNGRAWGDVGTSAVMTSNNQLVADVSTGCSEIVALSDKLPPPVEINGTVAFLSVQWGGVGYFHWMFDLISRVDLLHKSGIDIDRFVVNSQHLPYQRETLASLGISTNKIIDNKKYPHLIAKTLIVPSTPSQGLYDMITKWSCEYLKKEFLGKQEPEKAKYPHRLYISREQALYRKVRNQEAVLSLLERYGFQRLNLENMSVAECASYLAAATVVVAPHGAGLTNLVFCRQGTKVIEFFSPKFVPNCYWIVSNLCGLEHYYLIGEMFNDEANNPVQADIVVNLEQLEQLLKVAGVVHE